MKGLILKDFYTIRFQIIVLALILAIPNVMMIFMGGGMSVGAPAGSATEELAFLPYALVNYVTIVMFSSLLTQTIGDDVQSGWLKYQRTMPVSADQMILSKLAGTYILIGALVIISILVNLFGIFTFGIDAELMISIPICIGFMQVIIMSPLFPIALRLGGKASSAVYISVTIIVAAVMIVVAFAATSNEIPAYLMRIIFYGGTPVIAVTTALLSYFVGRKHCDCEL